MLATTRFSADQPRLAHLDSLRLGAVTPGPPGHKPHHKNAGPKPDRLASVEGTVGVPGDRADLGYELAPPGGSDGPSRLQVYVFGPGDTLRSFILRNRDHSRPRTYCLGVSPATGEFEAMSYQEGRTPPAHMVIGLRITRTGHQFALRDGGQWIHLENPVNSTRSRHRFSDASTLFALTRALVTMPEEPDIDIAGDPHKQRFYQLFARFGVNISREHHQHRRFFHEIMQLHMSVPSIHPGSHVYLSDLEDYPITTVTWAARHLFGYRRFVIEMSASQGAVTLRPYKGDKTPTLSRAGQVDRIFLRIAPRDAASGVITTSLWVNNPGTWQFLDPESPLRAGQLFSTAHTVAPPISKRTNGVCAELLRDALLMQQLAEARYTRKMRDAAATVLPVDEFLDMLLGWYVNSDTLPEHVRNFRYPPSSPKKNAELAFATTLTELYDSLGVETAVEIAVGSLGGYSTFFLERAIRLYIAYWIRWSSSRLGAEQSVSPANLAGFVENLTESIASTLRSGGHIEISKTKQILNKRAAIAFITRALGTVQEHARQADANPDVLRSFDGKIAAAFTATRRHTTN